MEITMGIAGIGIRDVVGTVSAPLQGIWKVRWQSGWWLAAYDIDIPFWLSSTFNKPAGLLGEASDPVVSQPLFHKSLTYDWQEAYERTIVWS